MSMIRGLNIRTGTALAIVLTLLAVGIVYAVQIERTVTGFGAIGQVQTVEETVLLWGSLDPRTELVQVDFGEMDVDAFGNLVTEVRFPLWVENGGGTPFALTVEAANVTVTPPGTGSRAAPGALGLLFGPAGGRLRPAPEHVVVLAPGPENAIAGELMLEFLVAPEELGPTGTQLSLDIVFVADDELPRPPPPTPTPAPTATPRPAPTSTPITGECRARRIVGGLVEICYGEPRYGGRMPVQALIGVSDWDPHTDFSCAGCPAPQYSPSFNSLLQFNPWTFDRYDIWGDLAESWAQVDAEGTVWEFTLKPAATWWDGRPGTAEDIAYSFDRMTGQTLDHPTALEEARLYINPNFDFAEAIDERTVRIHLLQPWADFLYYAANDLISMVPKHHYEPLDALAQDDPGIFDDIQTGFQHLMGSGPFEPSFLVDRDQWGYDKNPTYWKLDPEGRSLPYMDGMDYYRIVDRTASQAAWEAEQLWETNWQTNGNMSPSAMQEMITRTGERFVAYPAACCPMGIAMNVSKPPFDNFKVRRAIMLAIDRQAHNDLVWDGLGAFGTFCGPPGHPLCMTEEEVLAVPGWRQPKDQDYAEARQLLAEAGYENGFSTTFITSNDLASQDEGPVLQDTLRTQFNIDVELIVLDRPAFFEAQGNGDYDLISSGSGAGVITPDQYLNQFFLVVGRLNPFDWRYCGPCIGEEDVDLHALIRGQSRTLDPVARRSIVRQIDDITLTKDTHVVMNYTRTYARLFNSEKVGGQQPTATGYQETKAEQLWLLNP